MRRSQSYKLYDKQMSAQSRIDPGLGGRLCNNTLVKRLEQTD